MKSQRQAKIMEIFETASEAATGKIAEMIVTLGDNFDSEGLVIAFREKNPELMNFLEAMGASTETIGKAVEGGKRHTRVVRPRPRGDLVGAKALHIKYGIFVQFRAFAEFYGDSQGVTNCVS